MVRGGRGKSIEMIGGHSRENTPINEISTGVATICLFALLITPPEMTNQFQLRLNIFRRLMRVLNPNQRSVTIWQHTFFLNF